MRKKIVCLVTAMAWFSPCLSNAAEPIYGVWGRDGHPDDKLEFYDCANKLCAKGTLPLPDGSPPPEILRNAAKSGANGWKGDLYNPEDGKTYGGQITYDSPTKLTLTGCLMGFLCQSETWTRISSAPKPAAAENKTSETHKSSETAKETPKEKETTKPAAAVAAPKTEVKAAPAKTPAPTAQPVKPAASGAAPSAKPVTAVTGAQKATASPPSKASGAETKSTSAPKATAAPVKPAPKPATDD
jgi:uncharacterized protein (DUF2147 family)